MTTLKHSLLLILFSLSHLAFGQGGGLIWTDQTPPIAATWNGVTTGINPVNGTREFLVVGTNTVFAEVATSPDGETWTRRPSGIGGIFHDVTFDQKFAGEYVAVGTNSSAAIVGTSPDGITWTARPSGVGGVLYAVTNSYPRRGLLAVGSTGAGALVITSDDLGRTWTSEPQGGILPLYGVTQGASGRTIAVGAAGTILESVGGLDFVPQTAITANDLYDVTYHDVRGSDGYVAVGQNGAILFKPNQAGLPPVWQLVPSITADHLNSVDSYNGLLVATGSDGRVLTSPDGLNWTASPPVSITGNHLNGLTAGIASLGGRWVTVGTNSAIFTSPTTGGVGSGPGTLTVDYAGPTSIPASGRQNLGFTVEANGADIQTFIEASSMISLLNPDPQTIPNGEEYGYAFEVSQNVFEAERSGVIRVVGGSSTVTIPFVQAGAVPLAPSLAVRFDPANPADQIPLTWSAGLGTTRGFRLEVERPLDSDNWVVLGSGDTTFLDYTDTGLPSWSIQHYRLFATNPNGDSLPAERYIRTRPTTPPDFTAMADGWSRVELTWSDIPEGGSYRIERSLNGGVNWQGIHEFDDFTPGTNRFLDTGLPADTLIHYRMTVSGSQNTAEVIPNLINFWSLPRVVTAQTTPYTGQIFWETAVEESLVPLFQNGLRSVAYGGGKYIAVGLGGDILSSPDGSTWTPETPPAGLPGLDSSHTFLNVIYANGIWLIGTTTTDRQTGFILRSTGDGIWTLQTIPGVWSIQRIVYQNGTFLANVTLSEVNSVWGYKGRLFTSTDGMSWTAVRDLDDSGSISAGNGQFIASSYLDGVQVSSDGATWTPGTGSHTFHRAFGGAGVGQWFGTGRDLAFQPYASRSPDGVTWTDGPDAFPGRTAFWIGAAASNFISLLGDQVVTSPDSQTWSSPVEILAGAPFYSAAFGPQGWVAIGEGGVIARSTDLMNWTIERPYLPRSWGGFTVSGLAYGAAGEIVAVGGTGGIMRRDPVSGSWTQQAFPNSPALQPTAIDFIDGEFLVGSHTSTPTEILRSPDGINWTREVVSSETGSLQSFASGNGVIVAVGTIGLTPKTAVSNDGGTSWTTVPRHGKEVIFSDGKFYMIGGSTNPDATSVDGVNWTPLSVGIGDGIAVGLAEGGYRTIVGVTQTVTASPGKAEVSIDGGQRWRPNDFGGTEVIYGDGVFIMRKLLDGTIYASLDGLNWEQPPLGVLANDQHGSLAVGPGSEIAIGSTSGVVRRLKVSARPLMREEFDGVPDAIEDGAPNGGDGNNDGIPDRSQDHVTSLPANGGGYLTLVSPVGTVLTNVRIAPNAAPNDLPLGVSFPFGLLAFEVNGITPGASVVVDVLYPSSLAVTDYLKYGPLAGSATPLWYDFSPDGTTGAVLSPGRARLTFVDGGRGDDDLKANGRITDDGGPAMISTSPGLPWPGPPPTMTLFTSPGTQDIVTLSFATEAGVRYHLQCSENLVHFETLQRVIALGSLTQLTDLIPDDTWQNRFYRIVEIR